MALEYFTEPELRALPQMSNTTTYPLVRIESVAASLVARFEDFCGFSFVPRTHIEIHSGTDVNRSGRGIVLRRRRPIAVASLEQDGAAFADIAGLRVRGGVVRHFSSGSTTPSPWNEGVDNVEVTYTAGYSTVPADIKEAALLVTRWRLLATNSNAESDGRRTSVTNDVGGTINFVVAGAERPTGYPDVDAVLIGYKGGRAPLIA